MKVKSNTNFMVIILFYHTLKRKSIFCANKKASYEKDAEVHRKNTGKAGVFLGDEL